MTQDISLYIKTPTETKMSIFYLEDKKDREGEYLTGLVKAYGEIVNWATEPEIKLNPGIYIMGVDGASKVYDQKLAKSIPYELELTNKNNVTVIFKNIFTYLLFREVENLLFARKGEKRE